MIPTLTAKQSAFFLNNGFLELEGLLTPSEIALISSLKEGRDLWRTNSALKKLLLSRKMGSILLPLVQENRILLALDHKYSADFYFETPEKIKTNFSIQGISVFLFFQVSEPPELKPAKLGHYPFCQSIGSILIVKPDLLIAWPKTHSSIFLAAYSDLNSVYIENPRDLAAGALRSFGYEYGDILRNETHPLLQRADYR
jgi:hypothetical protein